MPVQKAIDLVGEGAAVEDAVQEALDRAGLTLEGIESFEVRRSAAGRRRPCRVPGRADRVVHPARAHARVASCHGDPRARRDPGHHPGSRSRSGSTASSRSTSTCSRTATTSRSWTAACGARRATPACRRSARACSGRLRAGDVSRVVVTHAHIDHYGLAGRVLELTGAELWMHAMTDLDCEKYRHPGRRGPAARTRTPTTASRPRRSPGSPARSAAGCRTCTPSWRPPPACAAARRCGSGAGRSRCSTRPGTRTATSASGRPPTGCCSRGTTSCRASRRR